MLGWGQAYSPWCHNMCIDCVRLCSVIKRVKIFNPTNFPICVVTSTRLVLILEISLDKMCFFAKKKKEMLSGFEAAAWPQHTSSRRVSDDPKTQLLELRWCTEELSLQSCVWEVWPLIVWPSQHLRFNKRQVHREKKKGIQIKAMIWESDVMTLSRQAENSTLRRRTSYLIIL